MQKMLKNYKRGFLTQILIALRRLNVRNLFSFPHFTITTRGKKRRDQFERKAKYSLVTSKLLFQSHFFRSHHQVYLQHNCHIFHCRYLKKKSKLYFASSNPPLPHFPHHEVTAELGKPGFT